MTKRKSKKKTCFESLKAKCKKAQRVFTLKKIKMPSLSLPKVKAPSRKTMINVIVGAIVGAAVAALVVHKYDMKFINKNAVEHSHRCK